MNREVKKYFRELHLFIPVSGKQEIKFIRNVQRNMEDYLSDHCSASYDEICNRFGTPKDVAINYFEATDVDYLIRKIRFSTLIKRAIFCVILFVAVACAIETGLYYRAYLDAQNDIHGYYEDIIE